MRGLLGGLGSQMIENNGSLFLQSEARLELREEL